jgi:hypothetical protein
MISKLKTSAAKIFHSLKSEPGPAPVPGNAAGRKNSPPQGAAGLMDLVVWSVPPVNTRLLICHAPGVDGSNPMNLVSVTVRDNSRFMKKMALRARPVSQQKFDLEGPLPRWRGRW